MADPSPRPDDLAAVRARVRTAVDRWTGTDTLVLDKADVLALLAPTLTEEERHDVAFARAQFAGLASSHGGQRLLAIIDRLSGSTSTGGPE